MAGCHPAPHPTLSLMRCREGNDGFPEASTYSRFYSNALFPLPYRCKAVEQMSAEKALPNHDPGDRVHDGRLPVWFPPLIIVRSPK